MEQTTTDFTFDKAKNSTAIHVIVNPPEIRIIEGSDQTCYLYYRHQLLAQYEKRDNYARNMIIVQLFLSHQIRQKTLAQVFQLTVQHISTLVNKYRQTGSTGIQDRTVIRISNNQKIKGKIAEEIKKQLNVTEENKPSYHAVAKHIKQKYGVQLSPQRISCWWRETEQDKQAQQTKKTAPEQLALPEEETTKPHLTKTSAQPEKDKADNKQQPEKQTQLKDIHTGEQDKKNLDPNNRENNLKIGGQWQINHVAGSFILYAMLNASGFLSPFIKHLKDVSTTGSKTIERVMLTLFFLHALRLKSIEKTKHLIAAHFGPLVLGAFCRLQNLRYAIDDITEHKNFDYAVTEHYQCMSAYTELGDNVYYTDGHFSCYYGKHPIPKGYDARRKQAQRGRNTIYLHNSLGHNILSFESPTNTTLSVDIITLISEMKTAYGDVEGKNLFFDRGGYSADGFKKIKAAGMYFTTYLKGRKKHAEIDEALFKESEITVHGTKIKNRLYETESENKTYGKLRIIYFIGKQGKQIPVISTNPILSAVELVARIQKRWVEENGFKYMGEHFNIDLLTRYETEEAPDKIICRANPERKAVNKCIAEKKATIKELNQQYASKLNEVKEKDKITIAAFEETENKLKWAIKNEELALGLLELKRKDIPSKVESNMKDESVISSQKRRLFINLIKTMNYNCEKWLQQLFCQYHPKVDETLSLIRHVLTQPGRIRQRGQTLEVELERLDSGVQAKTLDAVLKKLKEDNLLHLPDGRKLAIWQAKS